jgi:hypothetical protein
VFYNGEVMRRPNTIEDILARIDKTPGFGPNGDCWRFDGKWKGRGGYAKVRFNWAYYTVTRLLYEYMYGLIPEGFEVCHLCHYPPCCRYVDHLMIDTHRNNILQSSEVERMHHKLSHEEIKNVHYLHYKGYNSTEISKIFNVSQRNIRRIVGNSKVKIHISVKLDLSDKEDLEKRRLYFANKGIILLPDM